MTAMLFGCLAFAPSPTVLSATAAVGRATETVALAAREAQLHSIARRAFLSSRPDEAERAYELAQTRWGSSRSFLLHALLLSRQGNEDAARDTFRNGIASHPRDASLMQAWGLFESKHGHLHTALRLLRRAVVLNPDKNSAVLRWRRFQTAEQPRQLKPKARAAASPCMSIANTASALSVVERPAVKYTIPQAKRGWRGRGPEYGEEVGSWYDAEGKRNGPPQNYWRQSMDERTHRNAMAALDAVLDGREEPLDELIALERRMAIARPLRNRKILGHWAVVVSNGVQLASRADEDGGDALLVGAQLRVARAGERRTYTHRYGELDEHMQEGEELEFILDTADAQPAVATALATEANERRSLPLVLPDAGALHLGGVTLLTDYLLIARSADGTLQEFYVRIPEA